MSVKCVLSSLIILSVFVLFGKAANAQTAKYPNFSESQLIFQGDAGKWDADKVHTFSVVEANKDGYKYWAYYGLSYYGGDPANRKCGLARSNDLVHWEKYDGNPLISNDCRWPTVIFSNSVFYMFYAEYNADNDSRIVMVTSKDGIHFGDKTEVVEREKGKQNQNPFAFYNEKDKTFYLTYYCGDERNKDTSKTWWSIKIKKSKNIEKLAAVKPKTLMKSHDLVAAPSIVYFNNKYYLLVESRIIGRWDDKWVTLGYESNKPDGKYKLLANDPPVLHDGDACAFEYVFNNQLYVFYSHCLNLDKFNWELRMVKSVK
ncbi:MAG: hypothetical protein P4L45_04540 [Ignavibacteriaceae bacterium]|nr:hypothetical protein [Ignavibacteriaceae bacterium]